MIYVLYVSSATRLMTDDELLQLLRQCRENNRAWGITGMLLYGDGSFVQVLEGPEAAVEALLRTIERDPRHKGVLELLRGDLIERNFPDWAMGFRSGDSLSPDERAEISSFLQTAGGEKRSESATPHEAIKFLETFRKLMV